MRLQDLARLVDAISRLLWSNGCAASPSIWPPKGIFCRGAPDKDKRWD